MNRLHRQITKLTLPLIFTSKPRQDSHAAGDLIVRQNFQPEFLVRLWNIFYWQIAAVLRRDDGGAFAGAMRRRRTLHALEIGGELWRLCCWFLSAGGDIAAAAPPVDGGGVILCWSLLQMGVPHVFNFVVGSSRQPRCNRRPSINLKKPNKTKISSLRESKTCSFVKIDVASFVR